MLDKEVEKLAQEIYANEIKRLGALGSEELCVTLAKQSCTAAFIFAYVAKRHEHGLERKRIFETTTTG